MQHYNDLFIKPFLNPPNQKHASHARELDHELTMAQGQAMQYLYSSDKFDYHPAERSMMMVGYCSNVYCC
jgi:hypothetical protein